MIFQTNISKINDSSGNISIYLLASIMLFYGVSIGINVTNFSLFLHQMGIAKSQITNILSLELTGSIIAAPIFPKICKKYGTYLTLTISLSIRAITLFIFPLSGDLKFSMLCLFFSGFGGFGAITALWFWASSILSDKNRNTMIAIIYVAYRTGVAIGVGMLLFKANKLSIDLFKTSALFSAAIIVALYFIKDSIPNIENNNKYTPPSKLVKYIMIPVICIMSANYFLLALSNFSVIYAIKSNLPYREAAFINIYMLLGNLMLTVPIAMILDKIGNRTIPILGLICISCILIPFTIHMEYLPMISFGILSSLISMLFISSISIVSAKFSDHNLLSSLTLMFIMYSIGGHSGINVTKSLMEYWGNQGLIISIATISLFVILYIIYSQEES